MGNVMSRCGGVFLCALVLGLLLGDVAVRAADFRVAPVEGAPPPLDERLARLVSDAMNDYDLPATTDPNEDVVYVLKGKASAKGTAGGTATSVEWEVTRADGAVLRRLRTEDVAPYMASGDPWAALDMESLKRLAVETARTLEDSRDDLESAALSAPTTPAAGKEPLGRIAIGPINGAPGDGTEMLTQALAQVMAQYNVEVVPRAGPDVYVTKGSVELVDKNADTQTVRIDWQLNGPNGQNYGTVEQENDVPRGSLDSQWGDAAVYAAAGAGDGLVVLMQRLGPTPPKVNE